MVAELVPKLSSFKSGYRGVVLDRDAGFSEVVHKNPFGVELDTST